MLNNIINGRKMILISDYAIITVIIITVINTLTCDE